MANPSSTPNPVACKDAGPDGQQLLCRHRGACLMAMARAKARGFHCRSCDAYERLTNAELEAENESLARLGAFCLRGVA